MLRLIVRKVLRSLSNLQQWAEEGQTTENSQKNSAHNVLRQMTSNDNGTLQMRAPRYKVVNIWDYLNFKEGSQAAHMVKVLDFEEWVSMEEILRRVNELFGITYQNERSLYPYLKTLVDSGLIEANMTGGKMKWKKRNLMITVQEEIEIEANAAPIRHPLAP